MSGESEEGTPLKPQLAEVDGRAAVVASEEREPLVVGLAAVLAEEAEVEPSTAEAEVEEPVGEEELELVVG